MNEASAKREYVPNAISRKSNAVIVTLFAIYSLICILPVLLVVMVSVSTDEEVTRNGYDLFPAHFSLKSYEYLFKDPTGILNAYGATITATVVGTVVGLVITAGFAYPLSKQDFRFRGFFSFFAFFTMLFNGGLVPWYIVYSKYVDLDTTIWALIVPNLLMNAFFVLLMRTFFVQSIPSEIYESANIDGAGDLTVFFKIILPLSTPVLATVGLFYILQYWNDWYNSLIFQLSDKNISLQYLMQRTLLNIQYVLQFGNQINAQTNVDFPGQTIRMAMAVVGIGPLAFVYPFFQRFFVKGLTVGALKG